MTALLLLKYSVLLATISQWVKARQASKKEGKCDKEINPGPAGPFRARQAEHDVLQPPHPGGRAARLGVPQHPKYLGSPHLAASLASSPKCCKGTVGASQVSLRRAEHPLGSSISSRKGMLPSLLRAAAKPEPRWVPGIALAVPLDEDTPPVSRTLLRVLSASAPQDVMVPRPCTTIS